MNYPEPKVLDDAVEAALWDIADGMIDSVAEGRISEWAITDYTFHPEEHRLDVRVVVRMPLHQDFIQIDFNKPGF